VLSDVLDAAGSSIEFVVPKAGEGNIPITDKYSLTAVLTPTPRWPDAMCIIDPASKVVFTSKFFSAHVAPGLLNSKVGCVCQLRMSPGASFLGGGCKWGVSRLEVDMSMSGITHQEVSWSQVYVSGLASVSR